jgi:hypothetical protein
LRQFGVTDDESYEITAVADGMAVEIPAYYVSGMEKCQDFLLVEQEIEL